jgi:hypothetical protein
MKNEDEDSPIDTLPGDAGGAAARSMGAVVDDLFSGDSGDAGQPAAQPAAPKPELPEDDPGNLGGFVPIDEAPPPEATKPEPSEDLVPEHVVRKGEEAIKTWKQLRGELEAERQKAADIERDRQLKDQELEELRKKIEAAPPAEEIEKLKKELEAKESFIGQIEVTQSKVFREQYDAPINELFGKVVRQFAKAGHDKDSALALARKVFRPGLNTPQALEQVVPDESAVTIGAISSLLEDREVLASKREQAIQNWRETREAAMVEERRRASTEIGQQLTRVSEVALDAVVKDGSWLFKPGQDPKWNEGVEARKSAAIGYIRAGKPEDLARLVFEGIASPVYRKGYEQLKAKYDELKGKYEAIANRGRPSLSGHAPAPAGVPSRVAQAPASVGEAVDRLWSED